MVSSSENPPGRLQRVFVGSSFQQISQHAGILLVFIVFRRSQMVLEQRFHLLYSARIDQRKVYEPASSCLRTAPPRTPHPSSMPRSKPSPAAERTHPVARSRIRPGALRFQHTSDVATCISFALVHRCTYFGGILPHSKIRQSILGTEPSRKVDPSCDQSIRRCCASQTFLQLALHRSQFALDPFEV